MCARASPRLPPRGVAAGHKAPEVCIFPSKHPKKSHSFLKRNFFREFPGSFPHSTEHQQAKQVTRLPEPGLAPSARDRHGLGTPPPHRPLGLRAEAGDQRGLRAAGVAWWLLALGGGWWRFCFYAFWSVLLICFRAWQKRRRRETCGAGFVDLPRPRERWGWLAVSVLWFLPAGYFWGRPQQSFAENCSWEVNMNTGSFRPLSCPGKLHRQSQLEGSCFLVDPEFRWFATEAAP